MRRALLPVLAMHAGDEGADAAMPGAARPDILALEAFDEVNRVSQDSPEGLTPAQIRAVCDAHCLVCQQTIGGSEQARILACRLQGCELRGVDAWMAEVAWLSDIVQSPLWGSAPVPAQAVSAFNLHIHQAACATFAIGLAPDGTLERSYAATTLRGLIHAALILLIAYNAGDRLNINVLSTDTKGARSIVGQQRNIEGEQERAYARELRRQGMSINQIHKRMNVARSTVARWTEGIVSPRGHGD